MDRAGYDRSTLSETKWVDLYTRLLDPIECISGALEEFVIRVFLSSGMLPDAPEKGILTHLTNMVSTVHSRYNENKYHSFTHACHVLANCAKVLEDLVNQYPKFSKAEGLALLFAAFIHDIGHLGVSNETLVGESHALALLYSDQSVAEMHSLASGFEVIDNANNDIRVGFSPDERKIFRSTVIELVLSTNICDYERQRLLQHKLNIATETKLVNGRADMSAYTSRLSIFNLVIRAADVGASMQNAETSRIWSHRFFLEQKDARIAARGPKGDDSEFYFQHGKFMERHAAALAASLAATCAISLSLSREIVDTTHKNIEVWLIEGPSIVKSWCTASSSAENVPFS
jgi:3'5'-cyclic nucleotide phosphodiesterase